MIELLRGHKIELLNDEYIYSDTKESTVDTHKTRPCGHCGLFDIIDGYEAYDGCLGKLPDTMNACCGHGVESSADYQFLDGSCLEGKEAINEMKRITRGYYYE